MVTQEEDVPIEVGHADAVRVRREVLRMVDAVMVRNGRRNHPGVVHVMVNSADAQHRVGELFEAHPETVAGRWGAVIVASVVLMSALLETVALRHVDRMTGAPMTAVSTIDDPATVVLKTVALRIAGLAIVASLTGVRVVGAFLMVTAAVCDQVVQSVLTSVLMNNRVVRPVRTAQRVSQTICSGGVTPPRQRWRQAGPFIASGAPVRCEALPNLWRCCAMPRRLACLSRKSPGRVWPR